MPPQVHNITSTALRGTMDYSANYTPNSTAPHTMPSTTHHASASQHVPCTKPHHRCTTHHHTPPHSAMTNDTTSARLPPALASSSSAVSPPSFLRSQEDVGWTPWSLVAFVAEWGRLRRATFKSKSKQTATRIHAIPGFVRWEGTRKHSELNSLSPMLRELGPSSNYVPLDWVIGNDLFFKLCVPPRVQTHDLADGSGRYIELCNPHQGMWVLPREMLRAKLRALEWSEGRPLLPDKMRPQEWHASGWLFRCPRQRKLYQYCNQSRGAIKLTPCERACDFLVPHFGHGKYAYGNASEWYDALPSSMARGLLTHQCPLVGWTLALSNLRPCIRSWRVLAGSFLMPVARRS